MLGASLSISRVEDEVSHDPGAALARIVPRGDNLQVIGSDAAARRDNSPRRILLHGNTGLSNLAQWPRSLICGAVVGVRTNRVVDLPAAEPGENGCDDEREHEGRDPPRPGSDPGDRRVAQVLGPPRGGLRVGHAQRSA